MYISDEIIEEIRTKTDIVSLISSYINIKKNGNNYIGLCPFHSEKTPSFSVSPSKQMYYCFGCGVGGNAYTFVMEYDNVEFPEAVSMLANRVGVSLPQVEQSEAEMRQASLRKRLLQMHTDAGLYYYSLLKSPQGQLGYEYLKKRELSDEIIKKFGLGYTGRNSGLYGFLKSKGFGDSEISQSGLITFDEQKGPRDKFWNRVMFPIMDVNNKVIAFGGRVMGDGMPKYLNSPETKIFDKSRNLYGINYAKTSRTKYFLLCEGYMDVIALHQAGFTCACASLGTAFTGLQANLIKRYVNQVIITYDNDGAGVKAALRAIPILKGVGLSVKVLNMSPFKDPDEFIQNLGAEEYQKRIDRAQNSFHFEIEILEKEFDFSDPEQKTLFYNEMAKKLLMFEEEIERNNYIESLAIKYNIKQNDLKLFVAKQSAARIGIPHQITKNRIKNKNEVENGDRQAQGLLLTWISNTPQLLEKVMDILGPEDFYEEPYATVAKLVYEQYVKEKTVNPAQILNHFKEVEEQNIVANIFNRHLPEEDLNLDEREKVLNEIVKRIRKQKIGHLTRTASTPEELQKLVQMTVALQKVHISL